MSNEAHETVADIVAEKRREAQHIRNIKDTPRGRREALDLDEEADRIEAAYGRLETELRDLKRENACLLAALKPVLEVALSYEDGELINRDDGEVCTDSEYAVSVNGKPIDDHTLAGCLAAVREAQGIYDGSKESEVK